MNWLRELFTTELGDEYTRLQKTAQLFHVVRANVAMIAAGTSKQHALASLFDAVKDYDKLITKPKRRDKPFSDKQWREAGHDPSHSHLKCATCGLSIFAFWEKPTPCSLGLLAWLRLMFTPGGDD